MLYFKGLSSFGTNYKANRNMPERKAQINIRLLLQTLILIQVEIPVVCFLSRTGISSVRTFHIFEHFCVSVELLIIIN